MKILLIGEYNSSHYTLKEGLVKLGHEVLVVGDGDSFKKRLVDIKFDIKFTKGIPYYLRQIIFKIFKIDITSIDIQNQFNKHKHLFKDYDIVQLINESPFKAIPKVEIKLLDYIFENNKNVFLLSCGTDHVSVKYAYDKKIRYSILNPYFENRFSKKEASPILMYLLPNYISLHTFIYKKIKGVIASDFDYHIPLLNHKKYIGLAPNPINCDKLKYINLDVTNEIVIFHGINIENYHKKGNDFFEKALKIIKNKYPNRVKVITAKSLPYNEYITSFDEAHILLDQVYAYDQGFNALEAMAKGKVVFTGAETEWLDYYNLKEDTVAINALPDVNNIVEKLEWLILNPNKIIEISINARSFIEKEHHYINIAENYLKKWATNL